MRLITARVDSPSHYEQYLSVFQPGDGWTEGAPYPLVLRSPESSGRPYGAVVREVDEDAVIQEYPLLESETTTNAAPGHALVYR